MLEINNLNVSFKNQKILKELSLKINKNEVIGILGKNGAGKSTLFNSIYRNIKFDGEILINNRPIEKNDIGFVEAENYFYPYMLGEEYLKFFNKNELEINKLVKIFNIPLNKFIDEYSTGMKKKIAIISTIALNRPILLLDEPFNGLDMESVENLYLVINELKKKNITIIISSHIIETLINVCDKICFLQNSTIQKTYDKVDFKFIENDIRSEIKNKYKENEFC